MEIVTKKPLFTASAESQAIAKLLSSVPVGNTITYEEAIAATGEKSLSKVRGFLQTARRAVFRESGIVFDAVCRVGMKRLSDSEKVSATKGRLHRIRKAAVRANETLASAELENLSTIEKREALCVQAQCGAIMLASSISAQNLISKKIESGKTLAVGNLNSLFQST